MKAAQINIQGGPEVIEITDVDVPKPSAGQVLVEVHASSLNPFDSKLREGMMPVPFPFTLGGDIAGIVTELGKDVSQFSVGDKVYGSANALSGNSGAFAEFTTAKVNGIAKMPGNLDFNQAAAMPLVSVSAWQALVKHINLQAGQKLFIHGGAGGIGTMAIQMAKHIGAYVAVTATGEGIETVKQLGADEVIDYKTQDFTTVLSEFDAVFDMVGGDETLKAAKVLRSGGIIVSMVSAIDESEAGRLSVTAVHQMTRVTTEALDAVRELVESGTITPQVDSVYPLGQIVEAFRAREQNSPIGKVVLAIKQ